MKKEIVLKKIHQSWTAIKKFGREHKVWSLIILLVISYGIYWSYGKMTSTSGETKYVTAKVELGTVVSSISGSGQVSATNQIEVKAKASGDVVYVGGKAGQEAKAGDLLVQLDATDGLKALRDAKANLESAQISLAKISQPADSLSLVQAENSLIQAQITKNNATGDLQKAYDDAFNTISNVFLDIPGVMSGLDDILHSGTITNGSENIDAYADYVLRYDDKAAVYRDDTTAKYQAAKIAFDKNFNDYKAVSRTSDMATLESLLSETYATTKLMSESVKSAVNLIDLYINTLTEKRMTPSPVATTHKSTLSTYTSKVNTHMSNLLNSINAIQSAKDTLESSTRSITEKQGSLDKLKAGTDPLDVQSSQLSVAQRQNALLDAQQNLRSYYIRAPFDGTVAKVSVKKGDSVSSGTSVVTFVSKQKIAEITLNEVDVAKVKAGQKVTLTFDAITDLIITGEVSEVDAVGTVSQGVVSYAVKIIFDSQDDRIKSGMSVSASIVTAVKQNVLVVPNSAIKSQGENYYVEMFATPLSTSSTAGQATTMIPIQRTIEIGSSNDTSTEIISGLKEGEQIIVKTIAAQVTTASSVGSLFGGNASKNPGASSVGRILR